ncbi:MAG TPA: response regulator [Alphaproteobacteria bacterium]|nr:response regulator [Alphaproteobacteria bacterium]
MSAETPLNHNLLQSQKPMNILAVEDDLFSMNFLKAQIVELGHKVVTAEDGKKAIDILKSSKGNIDVVLMDREMPVMDGLSAIRQMKQDYALRNIPVIMVTSADTMQEMQEGLDAGVFYYLTKPVKEEMLRSVLSAAVREAQQTKTLHEELGRHKASFGLIDTCRFRFRTLDEAESLSAFMANCFAEPSRVLPGLGELLINAVEHGNLGIGYQHKSELVDSGTWRAEIRRLESAPENQNKFVDATIAHKEDGMYVVITDQGEGFEWKKFLQIDPARAGDNHGRGIAQARAISFDKLTYNPAGNQVVAFVGKERRLEW